MRTEAGNKLAAAVLSLLLAAAAGPAAAEGWRVNVKAVNGRVTYSRGQPVVPGRPSSYDGKADVRGGGPASDVTLNLYLKEQGESGIFRLDYQAEVSGANRARPLFQAGGKVLLRPGKPVLAASAGGWKLILELNGETEGKPPKAENGTLETSLKCGRVSYPASFLYIPQEQYSAVLYSDAGGAVSKFMLGLLPNSPGVDGTFLLQYTLLYKDGSETVAENQGELILSPGGPKLTGAAGKNCVFTAKALR